VFISLRGTCQDVNYYNYLQARYKDKDVIYLNKKEDINLVQEKGELIIKSKVEDEKYFINDKKQGYAQGYIYYTNNFEVSDIKAYLFTPVKGKYQKQEIKSIIDVQDEDRGIFFDDDRLKQILYPKVEAGYKTLYSYAKHLKDPYFLGKYYFSSFIPIEKQSVSITFPNDVNIGYTILNDQNNIIRFKKTTSGKKTVYLWEATEVPDFKSEDNSVPASYYFPTLFIYIKEYVKEEGDTVKILSDLQSLYDWYYTFIKDLNREISPELSRIVDSLTHSCSSETEKARRIFYWMQDHIRYIAFEDGDKGYKPSEAKDVLKSRYGDCKGMTSLLVAMLNAAGIKAHFSWIGSRELPYLYSQLASPFVADHMIATAYIDTGYYFMDVTGRYNDFGFPHYFIEGKEALASINDSTYKILKVPVTPHQKNYMIDSSTISLDENFNVLGKGVLRIGGYVKSDFLYVLRGEKNEKAEKALKEMLEKGNNKFRLDKYTLEGLNNRDGELIIRYSYTIPGYARKVDDALYINLNLDQALYNNTFDTAKRQQAEMLDYRYLHRCIVTFQKPEAYQIDFVPANTSSDKGLFGFDISYSHNENSVVQQLDLKLNTLLIEKKDFVTWNDMVKKLTGAYNQVLVLKKK
jgi:transglutaminase-like putative cysteine protease